MFISDFRYCQTCKVYSEFLINIYLSLFYNSFVISEEFHSQPMESPGSSTSSRDGSPSRDMSPLAKNLKPPIVIKKGARGYGFTLRAIRVYLGNSNTYALQHIVVVSTRRTRNISHSQGLLFYSYWKLTVILVHTQNSGFISGCLL